MTSLKKKKSLQGGIVVAALFLEGAQMGFEMWREKEKRFGGVRGFRTLNTVICNSSNIGDNLI